MAQSQSYSQYLLANDPAFIGRVASIMKDEGFSVAGTNPMTKTTQYIWDVAAQPGISEAYHSALLSGAVTNPGADDSVITDGALLAAVTAAVGGA